MKDNNLSEVTLQGNHLDYFSWKNGREMCTELLPEKLMWKGEQLSVSMGNYYNEGEVILKENDREFADEKGLSGILECLVEIYPDPREKESITMKELIKAVDDLGREGGGSITVTGTWRGQPRIICIEQTEWHETPVCLIGGYGNEVSSLHPRDVPFVLDCVLGNYFDCETFSIIES